MKNDKQQASPGDGQIGAATRCWSMATPAYVVVPSSYAFTQKGAPM